MRINILNPTDTHLYRSLTFQMNRMYLMNCDRENIIAVGASDESGKPCGLALAVTTFRPDGKKNDSWYLSSIFVHEEARRRGIGRELWFALKKELKARGCKKIDFQTVIREEVLEAIMPFFKAIGFEEPRIIARIFAFDNKTIEKSPFITGTLAGAFQPDPRFRFISFDRLTQKQQMDLEANVGGWYPKFVSPLLGKESMNEKCTTFAVDNENEEMAGWITAINVNDNTRLLYRSFFTREEYRDTPVGFFIFTEAVKNHLAHYRDRGGLASIPTDNDRAMRFSTLFFRDAYAYISNEIQSSYCFEGTKG